MNIESLKGQKFGRLLVLDRAEDHIQPSGKHRVQWRCLCECGNMVNVQAFNLKSGNSKSCGCLNDELRRTRPVKHGDRNSRLYRIWTGIKTRCLNPEFDTHNRYINRGITMCDEWINSYQEFKDWSLNNGYSDNLTIDRIDNNLGYSPENCRWSDMVTQANNRSTNVYYEYNGIRETLSWWSRYSGVKYHTLFARINKLNWPFEKAISTP